MSHRYLLTVLCSKIVKPTLRNIDKTYYKKGPTFRIVNKQHTVLEGISQSSTQVKCYSITRSTELTNKPRLFQYVS